MPNTECEGEKDEKKILEKQFVLKVANKIRVNYLSVCLLLAVIAKGWNTSREWIWEKRKKKGRQITSRSVSERDGKRSRVHWNNLTEMFIHHIWKFPIEWAYFNSVLTKARCRVYIQNTNGYRRFSIIIIYIFWIIFFFISFFHLSSVIFRYFML